MVSNSVDKCIALCKRLYTDDMRPGVIHERAVQAAGDGGGVLLEIGCGRDGRFIRRMGDHYRLAIGLDFEIAMQGEPDSGWRMIHGDAHHIPLPDETVDTVATKNVAEHLADPVRVFRECHRILKPGGQLIVLTVNQWFPPIVAARLLPHRVRQALNKIASGTEEEDTFPCYYKANTLRSLEKVAAQSGLEPVDLKYISQHPQYLMFSIWAYRLGVAMERVVRKNDGLAFLRHMLGAVFVKPN